VLTILNTAVTSIGKQSLAVTDGLHNVLCKLHIVGQTSDHSIYHTSTVSA